MNPPIFVIKSLRADGADGFTILDAPDEEAAIAYHARHWSTFNITEVIVLNPDASGGHTERLYSRFSYPSPKAGQRHAAVHEFAPELDELGRRRQAKQEEPPK